MDHAYKFGTLVCKHTIRYTEREKYFEGREKAHHKQVEFLRREVERLGEVIHQLGLDLETSQASLSASQTNLDATQNGKKKNADYPTCESSFITNSTNYQLIY